MSMVNTPTGISNGITVREKLSIKRRKLPPILMLAHTAILLLGPNIMRLICGTINPKRLMTPTAATAAAVIIVDTPTRRSFNNLGFTPTANASWSPSAKRLSFHRKKTSMLKPIPIGRNAVFTLSQEAVCKFPIVHCTMAWSLYGSLKYCKSVKRAVNTPEMIIPAKTILTSELRTLL